MQHVCVAHKFINHSNYNLCAPFEKLVIHPIGGASVHYN